MKNTVDNLSKSKVILMCGPAEAGKSTLAKNLKVPGWQYYLMMKNHSNEV
jgi:predicted kinase